MYLFPEIGNFTYIHIYFSLSIFAFEIVVFVCVYKYLLIRLCLGLHNHVVLYECVPVTVYMCVLRVPLGVWCVPMHMQYLYILTCVLCACICVSSFIRHMHVHCMCVPVCLCWDSVTLFFHLPVRLCVCMF